MWAATGPFRQRVDCPHIVRTPSVMMKYAETFRFPIQESHSFASAAAAWEAAVREKCLSTKPVSKAADKVIKLRVTSTSLHQLITIHVACLHVLTGHVNTERHMWYSYLFWLCLSLNTVNTVVCSPRTFTHMHGVISYLNMWITALNENPWLYFGLPIKADLFLHVPEPRGLLPTPSAPKSMTSSQWALCSVSWAIRGGF